MFLTKKFLKCDLSAPCPRLRRATGRPILGGVNSAEAFVRGGADRSLFFKGPRLTDTRPQPARHVLSSYAPRAVAERLSATARGRDSDGPHSPSAHSIPPVQPLSRRARPALRFRLRGHAGRQTHPDAHRFAASALLQISWGGGILSHSFYHTGSKMVHASGLEPLTPSV